MPALNDDCISKMEVVAYKRRSNIASILQFNGLYIRSFSLVSSFPFSFSEPSVCGNLPELQSGMTPRPHT